MSCVIYLILNLNLNTLIQTYNYFLHCSVLQLNSPREKKKKKKFLP